MWTEKQIGEWRIKRARPGQVKEVSFANFFPVDPQRAELLAVEKGSRDKIRVRFIGGECPCAGCPCDCSGECEELDCPCCRGPCT